MENPLLRNSESDFLFCFAAGLVNRKKIIKKYRTDLMSNLNCAVASSPHFLYVLQISVCVCVNCSGVLSDKPEIYTLK